MTDEFQDVFSRPSWSAQDRGNPAHSVDPALHADFQDASLNGNRRTSFGEMNLIGSLVTGSNEETLKA